MNLILITQNEPFYLKSNIEYLIKNLPENCKIVGCIVSDVSPFGKKESFLQKALSTLKIFGFKFFLRYALRFIKIKLFDSDLKKYLLNENIEIIYLDGSINSDSSLSKIRNFKPDLLISIAGNEIFKKNLIDLAPEGCLNLHTAMLPKYRGLMPTFWAMKNNEEYLGVSVFFVDEGIDSGPIIFQEKIKIEDQTMEDLIKETKLLGMQGIIKSIRMIMSKKYELIENDDKKSTYFSFPKRKDVREFISNGKKFF